METEEYKGYSIKITQDEEPMNPRTEWDNLGTMVVFWNNYNLGDKHTHPDSHGMLDLDKYYPNGFKMDKEEAQEFSNSKDIISIPLYIYEHGGLAMSSGSGGCFSDQWDAGCAGYLYITKEKIRKEYGWKNLTKKRIEETIERLKGEVETYDQYLQGAVYGFTIEKDDEEIELEDVSCWGFFGYDNRKSGLLDEAEGAIDNAIKDELDKHGIQEEMELA